MLYTNIVDMDTYDVYEWRVCVDLDKCLSYIHFHTPHIEKALYCGFRCGSLQCAFLELSLLCIGMYNLGMYVSFLHALPPCASLGYLCI